MVMDDKHPCNDHRYVTAYSQVFPVHWGPQSRQEKVFHQCVGKDEEEEWKPMDWGWQLAVRWIL